MNPSILPLHRLGSDYSWIISGFSHHSSNQSNSKTTVLRAAQLKRRTVIQGLSVAKVLAVTLSDEARSKLGLISAIGAEVCLVNNKKLSVQGCAQTQGDAHLQGAHPKCQLTPSRDGFVQDRPPQTTGFSPFFNRNRKPLISIHLLLHVKLSISQADLNAHRATFKFPGVTAVHYHPQCCTPACDSSSSRADQRQPFTAGCQRAPSLLAKYFLRISTFQLHLLKPRKCHCLGLEGLI